MDVLSSGAGLTVAAPGRRISAGAASCSIKLCAWGQERKNAWEREVEMVLGSTGGQSYRNFGA